MEESQIANTENRISSFCFARVEDDEPSALLMNLAHGYLKAAESVAVQVENDEDSGGVFGLLPAMFNLHQGVELFLKGVIHRLTGKFDQIHDLKNLAKRYDTAICESGTLELALKLDMKVPTLTYIDDHHSNGFDYRYILNRDNEPYWPGITLSSQPIVDASRDCRREFARIRRILERVKGWSAFWEEGTFARYYPERPLWFFCIPGPCGPDRESSHYEHRIEDDCGRTWLVYEGEAITEENCFHLSVGSFPKGCVRVQCALTDLKKELGKRRT